MFSIFKFYRKLNCYSVMLLIRNDAQSGWAWLGYGLIGNLAGYRECRVGGDFLLIYRIDDSRKRGLVFLFEPVPILSFMSKLSKMHIKNTLNVVRPLFPVPYFPRGWGRWIRGEFLRLPVVILKFRWGTRGFLKLDNESYCHPYDFVEKNIDPLDELWLPVAV
ncbi:MAG: hypothetical protein Q3M24_12155 [Candidatus Electrothrix aestuarii]|uniref:Uncharacterized protein n=1 Tax=Candidatus Electrothrix aestuarii TaxID=3062594 RepID=A0AAU8LQ89_9BACT|nr:hypothetical protein [Candidatus Electrothrix aestuarii]